VPHGVKVTRVDLIFAFAGRPSGPPFACGGRTIAEHLHVPIFPLPEVVLFPRTILPLHVFEPRYRRLVNDVLGGDKRFAVFLLKPAAEASGAAEAAPFEVGCLGEIVRAEALSDGRFNLLLLGLVRIRIAEFLTDVPYRVVGAALAPERVIAGQAPDAGAEADFRRLVARYFRTVLGRSTGADLAGPSLEALVNTAAANLRVDACERQRLLEAATLARRMARVAKRMAEQLEARNAVRGARALRPQDPRVN
jgi:Lon protease-like protein